MYNSSKIRASQSVNNFDVAIEVSFGRHYFAAILTFMINIAYRMKFFLRLPTPPLDHVFRSQPPPF